MKLRHIMPFIALLLLTLSFACDNSNDPDPTPVYSGPRICARDSVALTDIYFQAFGEMPTSLSKQIIDAYSPTIWIVDFALNEEKSEYYAIKLNISSRLMASYSDYKQMKLSPSINDLSDLTHIIIKGESFSGDFPPINKLEKLKGLKIIGTSFQTLPDDIFTDHLEYVSIESNSNLDCPLPSSISKLRGRTLVSSYFYPFRFSDNSFCGEIPYIPNASVILDCNRFDSYSMDNLNHASLKYNGIRAECNRINQEIPNEILEDTLKILVLNRDVSYQPSCTGLIGMPSRSTLAEMYSKYVKNHPDAIK